MKHSTVLFWLIFVSFSSSLSLSPLLVHGFPIPQGTHDELPLPRFAASWLDDKTDYKAGDVATIKIKVLEDSFSDKSANRSIYAMNFSLSVNEKKGNSTFISGVLLYIDGDPTHWKFTFIPIRVGNYSIIVTEDNSGVADSTLHFSVSHGAICSSMCDVSWMNSVNEFVAGTRAYLSVVPKDAFGNNISSIDIPNEDYFTVFGSYENGTAADLLDFKYNGWSELGFICLEFTPIHSGRLLLHVYSVNKNLSGSPLPFAVKSGDVFEEEIDDTVASELGFSDDESESNGNKTKTRKSSTSPLFELLIEMPR